MTSSVIFPPIDNYTVTYDIITRNNTRGDNQTERIEEIFHHQLQTTLETYVCPLIYLIGIPGNLLSFALWLMPRMRNSSGCYFATLAISDTIVLLTHMVLTVQVVCEVELLNSPFLCEAFNVLYVSSECWSVLLILGLTVDRYVIICHPMRRQSWCTISRTLKVILSLAMFAILLGMLEGIFWTYDSQTHQCVARPSVRIENGSYAMELGNMAILVFGVLLPSCVVLSLNVRIIQSLRKFSKARKSMMLRHKTSDTESTIMLLSVASYMILSEIPDSVVYLIQPYYPPTSPQHNTYGTVSVIFGTFSLTNYAINILIYSLTGRKFRRIFLICFQRMSCGHCSKDIGGLHMESPSSQVELQHFNLHSRKLDVAQNRQRYTVIAT